MMKALFIAGEVGAVRHKLTVTPERKGAEMAEGLL